MPDIVPGNEAATRYMPDFKEFTAGYNAFKEMPLCKLMVGLAAKEFPGKYIKKKKPWAPSPAIWIS